MNDTRAKLIYFLAKYGNDFFHKLPKYSTAKYKGECVKLIFWHPNDLTFTVRISVNGLESKPIEIDLFELDNFCL